MKNEKKGGGNRSYQLGLEIHGAVKNHEGIDNNTANRTHEIVKKSDNNVHSIKDIRLKKTRKSAIQDLRLKGY